MSVLFSSPTCFAEATIFGADKIVLSAAFFAMAFAAFLLLRTNVSNKGKIALIYAHLTFLFFPFVLLATNSACGALCMQCHNNYPMLISYALPGALAASSVAGLFVAPAFYTLSSRRKLRNRHIRDFVRTHAARLNIKTPALYLVDRAKPMAFSFRSLRSSIFLTVGLLDVLNKKELEAVLLHELAHIKQRSSMMKFSVSVMKVFSPFSLVAKFHDRNREEDIADGFAVSIQKTGSYVKSAKRKVGAFRK
jgi:Zn-dependent protease with chaperone function